MFTVREYFAEGVQSFFNCHISVYPPDGIHNNISTRVDLNKYDPDLYKILEEVFPCKNNYSWCYEGEIFTTLLYFTFIKNLTHLLPRV